MLWLAILVACYLTPLLSLANTLVRLPLRLLSVVRFFRSKKLTSPTLPPHLIQALKIANKILGTWEYYVRAPRNIVLGPVVFLATMIGLLRAATGVPPTLMTLSHLLFSLLTLQSFWAQRASSLKLVEFLRTIPILSPALFFDTLVNLSGPFGATLPADAAVQIIPPRVAAFRRDERSKTRYGLLLPLVWDTGYLAHMSLKALTLVGPAYARLVFDHMAAMWGKRILERAHLNLHVTGTEKLEKLHGKIILVLGHKSQLDFALTFFALSQIRRPNGRLIRPRFITAKDHFLDNPLVYDWLGVGRLIESVDMVFLERNGSATGKQSLDSAAKALAEKEIEIAIFPQGTRAPGIFDRSGKRRDAGYYTTVSAKDAASPLGHLKKGAAYLAVDTLMALSAAGKAQPVHLVFIGIRGSASVLPRQSLAFQTEGDIEFHLGDVMTLDENEIEGLSKPATKELRDEAETRYLNLVTRLHAEIDHRLAATSGIHETLRHRFLLDLQGHLHLSRDLLAKIERTFDDFAENNPLTFQILDRAYACPRSEWDTPLSDLAQIIVDGHGEKRIQNLWENVTQKMLETTDVKSR